MPPAQAKVYNVTLTTGIFSFSGLHSERLETPDLEDYSFKNNILWLAVHLLDIASQITDKLLLI